MTPSKTNRLIEPNSYFAAKQVGRQMASALHAHLMDVFSGTPAGRQLQVMDVQDLLPPGWLGRHGAVLEGLDPEHLETAVRRLTFYEFEHALHVALCQSSSDFRKHCLAVSDYAISSPLLKECVKDRLWYLLQDTALDPLQAVIPAGMLARKLREQLGSGNRQPIVDRCEAAVDILAESSLWIPAIPHAGLCLGTTL